jgi:mannitol-1-/sugar-/sorbitol-6-/2-deoxyglucose-6-phosphatase
VNRRAEQPARTARPIEAVVFDMDGVLIDSEPYWREVEIEVFGELGLELTPSMLDETMGMRVVEVVDHWAGRGRLREHPRSDVAARIVDRMVRVVRSRGSIAPGGEAAIELFERHGVGLALASSSPRPLIDATLEACGLEERF